MTTTSRPNRRMYSWWWDSHNSPKNSKWLQENLTDMDTKVKHMIKLLEEDADTFARKAEMYYKKRPELMKLVEDFYRAYRALAERYDNATGVLRQAQRTMAEAFPNQVSFDDSPAGMGNEGDPRTPEMPQHIRALFDSDELQKDSLWLSPQSNSGRRNGAFTEEPNSVTSRRGLKHFNDFFGSGEGRAKKGLNFQDIEEDEQNGGNNLKVSATEAEISALKEALAKLEAEKEAGLLRYQQSLDKLSNLESEVSHAQEDSTRLNDRASKAETEAQNLREALSKLESEQEASLLKYQQCLDKVSLLENDIIDVQRSAEEFTEIASKAENEAENMRQGLAEVEAEKEAALVQYRESLERIVKLEEKLLHAEESSSRYNKLADKAESELIILKQAVEKLTEEKEAATIQYLQCLEKISSLEYRLSCAEEEAERLHHEIHDGILKLRSVEEKCFLLETSNVALQSELESLVLKMESQSQELSESQKEQRRLWNCVQDEHLRFVEAETAFQTLQDLHSQTEEELRSLAAELQNRTHILKSLEIQNQSLVAEVQEAKNENRKLDELNVSSALSIKNLQDELSSLREKLSKLEAEVEYRTNERDALQQEIYCLKEEINDLNKKNGAILEQVESTGYNLDCFGTSVKKLHDEYSRMKATCETEKNEKAALLQKLIILEQLVETNAFLENSISDMSVDLEETKERVKMLEESCQSLLGEKSTLSSEKVALTSLLRVTTKNLEELSQKNTHLENSLSDAVSELEVLRLKSMDLEDSCQLLDQQKSGLITEKESLLYQLDTSHNTLEDLNIRYRESVDKHSVLSNERESAFCEIEKLKAHFNAEKQAHYSFTKISEKRLAGMELQMRLLQEECDQWKKAYEGETDKAITSQLVIFVLQNCVQDMKDNNLSLHLQFQKLLEESERSKEEISKLELENLKRREQIKSFVEKNEVLRTGLQRVSRTLFVDHGFDHETEQDQTLLNHIFSKLEEKKISINKISDEYYQLVIEKSITEKFLAQMKNEAANVLMERDALDQEHRIQSQQILILQSRIVELSEELKLKVMDGNRKERVLKTEMENVCRNLHNVEEAYQLLQVENFKALDEKTFLTKEVLDLGKQRCQLEEENSDMFDETIFQSQLFLICKDIISEILEEMRKLAEYRDRLQFRNNDLGERVKELERKLGHEKAMNLELTMFLEKSHREAENYLTEKNILDHEHRNQSERYLILQAEMEKLLELNEEMKLKVVKGMHKEEALTTERENVYKKLQDLEWAYQSLHDECFKANEAKIFLSKEILELRKDKQELEEENINMFTERVFQSELSFIYKDAVSENLAELRKLAECMDELHFRNNELEERVKRAYHSLHDESCKANEVKMSLSKEISELRKEKQELEEENINMFTERIFQSELSCLYKDVVSENLAELRKLAECMDELHFRNNELEERVKRAYHSLHDESCKANEVKMSLSKEISELRKEKQELEEENINMFTERIFQSELSCIYKDVVSENLVELRKLAECMNELHFKNNELDERVKRAYQSLYDESCKANEEKIFLFKEIANLRKEKQELEEVNIKMFTERIFQSELSFIYKDVISENLAELRKLAECRDELHFRNNELEVRVKRAYQSLLDESCKANEKKLSLSKKISELRKDKRELEEENVNMFTERIFQSELSFIYKDVVLENLAELRKLAKCMDELRCRNNELEDRVKVMLEKLLDGQTKNIELMNSVEKSQNEAENYLMEKKMLDQELRNQSELNSTLQDKMEKHLKLNADMNLKLIESNHREELLTTEKENVCKKLEILEGAYQILHAESIDMFGKTIFQSQLSFIYKDIVSENLQELRKFVECIDKLQSTNKDLKESVKTMEGKLGDEKTKNSELSMSLALSAGVIEEVRTLLSLRQSEKMELLQAVKELEEINEEQKKRMDKISSDKDCLAKETEFLREENRKMDSELKGLRNEVERSIIREESLISELQMESNEVQSWESQAATSFCELQISVIHQSVFEEKIHELTEACKFVQDRNTSKNVEIELLKDKIVSSEGENGRMKAQLAAYAPAIQTLKDSISSLEKHAIPLTKKQKVEKQEVKESDSATSQHPESFQQPNDDDQVHDDGSVELQDLNRRIQAIEVAFEEFESQTALDKFNVNAKLGKARKEIQVVKSGHESGRLTKDKSALREHDYRSHSKSEIYEAGSEVLTKDILLDQVFDYPSYENSQRETAAAGDRMLQLWESTDQDGSYNRSAGKAPMLASLEYHRSGSTMRQGSKHLSNESLVEKELGVDKLETSQRISELPQEGNKRRILERLDSDAEKLANLQITIQDLKKKMVVTEKSTTGKGAEYDTVKEQVKEAEETITKLSEMNLQLTKNVQDSFLAADGASTLGPEENDSVQSKRISEQARRESEKIGRLQLELKKLQFLIMKLDGERVARCQSKAFERSPRVLLRDFLYGGTRTKKKQKKKSQFCSCMRPSTRGD